MPEAIAISDNPDWWQILGDRDIGQPVGEWRSRGYRWQPGAFNSDHQNLGRASDVAYANAMTALESGMVSVRGRVTAVEGHTGTEAWPVSAKWRVQIDDGKWIYADTISLTGGLGKPRKLDSIANDTQLEKTLETSGRMVYAQQTLVPNVPKGATVVVVGDSGTAGWAAQEALRTGRNAIIVARDTSLFGVPPHVKQDLESHGVRIIAGEVKTTSIDGGKIVVGVSATGGRDDRAGAGATNRRRRASFPHDEANGERKGTHRRTRSFRSEDRRSHWPGRSRCGDDHSSLQVRSRTVCPRPRGVRRSR